MTFNLFWIKLKPEREIKPKSKNKGGNPDEEDERKNELFLRSTSRSVSGNRGVPESRPQNELEELFAPGKCLHQQIAYKINQIHHTQAKSRSNKALALHPKG